MMIDTHAHVNFKAYKKDFDEVIQRTLQNNVHFILVGTQYSTSKNAVEIAQAHEGIYAAIGIHPIQMMDMKVTEEKDTFKTRGEAFDKEKYFELAKSKKVVAVGEIGLDYYWLKEKDPHEIDNLKDNQRKQFKEMFQFAQEVNLPIIIHCRDAHNDLLEFLEELIGTPKKEFYGVCHSFTGNYKQALRYVDLGFMIGFNGIVTYSPSYDKAIKAVPTDRIVIETDCPYLTPKPLPRDQRNEPLNVKYVVEHIAEVLEVSVEEVKKFTTENAKKLFRIN